MSTSEKWINEYSLCPCGQGKILEHVESPDNPWSRMSCSYSLVCKVCSAKYILIGTQLHLKQEHKAAEKSWSKRWYLERELTDLCNKALDAIVADMCISYKDEYKLLKKVGLCSEGPIRYPRLRKGGKKASELCKALANTKWIVDKLSDEKRVRNISELKDDLVCYDKEWRNASAKDVPTSIESLKPK